MLVSLLRSIQARSDMICKKTSSLQGMVRPPIGWWYPYSSSALLSKSWNEGWFKHSIWITNRFFSSPTYTARYPFGTSAPLIDNACLALLTPSKRKPMVFVFCLLLHTHNYRMISKNLYDKQVFDALWHRWEWNEGYIYGDYVDHLAYQIEWLLCYLGLVRNKGSWTMWCCLICLYQYLIAEDF